MLCYGYRYRRLTLQTLLFYVLRCKDAHFSRWSSFNFSVRIDSVLFTELNKGLLGYSEQLRRPTPCAGTVEGFEYPFLLGFWIAVRQIFGILRLRVVKSEIICCDCISSGMEGGEKNSVLQFSDITRPRIEFQRLDC